MIRRPLLLITMTFAFVALCVAGFPRLQLDASLVRNFPKNNPVRIADDVAKARFGGSMPAEVALDGGDIDAWKDPAKLRALERLQDALEADGLVAETRSIADYIKRMNEVMNPGDPNGYTIPDDRRLIAQYLLLYSMSGEPDDFDDVVDYDYKMANIRVQVRSDASAVLEEFFARVNTVATAELAPLGITTTASGAARTQNTLMRLLIQGQMLSLAVALLLIVGITALFFRSPYAGIVVAIPVVTATFANFGALALVGEPLGVTTTMVSSVGIGMGIDFAIHFAVRYRSERFQGASPEQAIRMTMESAGTAIFFNALVVVAGFLVLIASDFLPNRAFGCLIALIMTVSFAATVTTLAAVLCWLDPAFLRPCAADGQDPSPPRTEASPLAA